MKDPRDNVAMVMALSLLIVFLASAVITALRVWLGAGSQSVELAAEWGVVVGLLIGQLGNYIARGPKD